MRFNTSEFSLLLSIILLAAALCVAVFPSAGRSFAQERGPARVSIVEDQEHAAFRFIIDGREAARLDGEGFHVRENVEFGGTLTDTGTAYYNQHIEKDFSR